MISGKLRGKAARDGAAARTLSVDDTLLTWSPRHGWNLVARGIRCGSFSVALKPERTRELILDVTLKMPPAESAPSEERILLALQDGIRLAMEAGWDPESRGRAFRFEITEE
jgi:hypothetical protein